MITIISYNKVTHLTCSVVMDLLLQEWPEENYPSYANGPGYVVSSDIAQFIISDFEKHKLRVSIFNSSMSSYFYI